MWVKLTPTEYVPKHNIFQNWEYGTQTLNAYFIISFPFTSKPCLFYLAFLTKQDTHIYLVHILYSSGPTGSSCRPALKRRQRCLQLLCSQTLNDARTPNTEWWNKCETQSPEPYKISNKFPVSYNISTKNVFILTKTKLCNNLWAYDILRLQPRFFRIPEGIRSQPTHCAKTFPTIKWITFLLDSKTAIFHARVMLLSSESK